ncbi:hypothetical protein J3E74DRAFT_295580 [Bipolaris maydis]|nr:hypothetical protein J3E74DRAFT_295992 [Bipolaris maydis]KAJ5052488.1 hypothetical protein J3E74DRAFT_295580 [Bipolaris maydis]
MARPETPSAPVTRMLTVILAILSLSTRKMRDRLPQRVSQAMSLYIMSTVVSQITLTCGGSSMPSALGSMLAEALPFLRSIATSIQQELSPEHPGVLPTTMVAYALTSLLLGGVFFALAALRCGRLTGYFPRTVKTGVVGAVGVSLFVLGLEIPFSSKSAHLSYKTLFEKSHLPLLAASLGPAVLLSSSGRLSCLERIPKKPTKHPLYIPLFCFAVAGVFWLVVATCKDASMKKLVSAGWLFSVEHRSTQATAAAEWDYWALFNFNKVEWYALSAGIRDIILLVLIGALSLPIFASEALLERGKSDNSMNHEFVGHGISNTIAGAIGTLPNLFVLSNSRFFYRATGRRPEAALIALLTLAFFFFSFRVLPYVPTIQASALVLFVGIELMLEALWDSTASLTSCEWTVVASTTIASTPRDTTVHTRTVECGAIYSIIFLSDVFSWRSVERNGLYGYRAAVFVVYSSANAASRDQIFGRYCQSSHIILNLEAVDSAETSVAEYIQTQAKKTQDTLFFSIVVSHTQLTLKSDLERGKVDCSYSVATPPVVSAPASVSQKQLRVYDTLEDAICGLRYEHRSSSSFLPANSLTALCKTILHQHNRNNKQFTLPELHSAGTVVRVLACGETIACSEYPFLPAFVILDGRVALREHATSLGGGKRMCIRKAVPSAARAIFRRKTTEKDRDNISVIEGSVHGAGPRVIAPLLPFCARVDSETCLILDIDARNTHWAEIIKRWRQIGAINDKK